MAIYLPNKSPLDLVKQGEDIFKLYNTVAERAERIISIWELAGLMGMVKNVSVNRTGNIFEITIYYKSPISYNAKGDANIENIVKQFRDLIWYNLAEYRNSDILNCNFIYSTFQIKK